MKCEIAKEIPWFEYYCKIENSKNVVEPGSTFTVSVTFYVPKSMYLFSSYHSLILIEITKTGTDAASLRVPFRLTNDEDKTFGPRLLLEGSLLSSITPLGLVMMPRKKYGYNTDVLIMLINLALVAFKQYGLFKQNGLNEDRGYDVNEVLDREPFVRSLATSLRYQLCLIPESFQISMMNTTQQFLIMDKKREMEFQTHKRRHGGSRWMFKTYDLSMSSWLFDLTTVESKDIVIDEPTFTYSLTRRGGVRNDEYFRVVTLVKLWTHLRSSYL